MTAMLIAALFALTACLAIAAIGDSLLRDGRAAFDAGRKLALCPEARELRYTLVTVEAGRGPRGGVRPAAVPLPVRRRGLRAAA